MHVGVLKHKQTPQPSPSALSSSFPQPEVSISLFSSINAWQIYIKPVGNINPPRKRIQHYHKALSSFSFLTLHTHISEWGSQSHLGRITPQTTSSEKGYGLLKRMTNSCTICSTMVKDVGVTWPETPACNAAVRAVAFVGSTTWGLTSSVELSHPKKRSLSSICIPFLATGSLQL